MIEFIYTLVMVQITIACVTLYLHRSQTHRAVQFHPAVNHFMRFWLWLTTGMVTKQWVAIHRKHHQAADTEQDPHSPKIYGIRRVLFGGALFAIFSGIYYWFPKMYGKMLNESLGRKHFYWSFIFFNLTFYPMHLLGVGGHMRRIYNPYIYEFLQQYQPLNQFITVAAIILGFSQFILIFNILWSLKYGKKAPRNPWQANSLEWAAPAHHGHGNFDTDIQVYRGPYEFSHPDRETDFYPQWEKPKDEPQGDEKAVPETKEHSQSA